MNEIWAMFQKGVGIGAGLVGAALVVALALPLIAIVCALLGRLFRIKKDDEP